LAVRDFRILLIGDYPPPPGGIAVHVQQLHTAFRRAGVSSRVLDIGAGGRPDPEVVRVRSKPKFLKALVEHATEGWLLHVHTSGNNAKAWLVAGAVATVARACGAPAVLTLHSGLLPRLLRRRGPRLLAGAAARPFDRIVAVSQPVADAMRQADASDGQVVVYPAFCASEVRPGTPPAPLAQVRAEHDPLLAMAHHPSSIYGRDVMFAALTQAAERFPRIGLALFGPGTDERGCQEDLDAYGVRERIHLLGPIDHGAALAVIAQSDAFVRPTRADGDSVSVREALAMGVRCLASDVTARPQGTHLFRTGDACDLVRSLDEALASERRVAPQPDAAEYLLGLYSELCRGRRHASPPASGSPPDEVTAA
jgi:glycogen synthase